MACSDLSIALRFHLLKDKVIVIGLFHAAFPRIELLPDAGKAGPAQTPSNFSTVQSKLER
jgi:hypothetical protein